MNTNTWYVSHAYFAIVWLFLSARDWTLRIQQANPFPVPYTHVTLDLSNRQTIDQNQNWTRLSSMLEALYATDLVEASGKLNIYS